MNVLRKNAQNTWCLQITNILSPLVKTFEIPLIDHSPKSSDIDSGDRRACKKQTLLLCVNRFWQGETRAH